MGRGGGAVPHRARHRGLGRLDEPRGRRRRAAPRHLGDAALPRRLQRRHGRVRPGGRRDVAGRRAADRALRRCRRRHRRCSPGGRSRTSSRAPPSSRRQPSAARQRHRSAWLEPRTLLIGVVVFAAAFTEGTANDWLAVAFVEGHELEKWVGVLAFATFLTFMTLGRIVGTGLLDRYGRVPVLRVSFALAALGAAMVIYGAPGSPSRAPPSGVSVPPSASRWA